MSPACHTPSSLIPHPNLHPIFRFPSPIQAIKGIRQKVEIATKFAISRDDCGNMDIRGDPEHIRDACEGSLKRLDIDCIDLYYQHRIDTRLPIEITVGGGDNWIGNIRISFCRLLDLITSSRSYQIACKWSKSSGQEIRMCCTCV